MILIINIVGGKITVSQGEPDADDAATQSAGGSPTPTDAQPVKSPEALMKIVVQFIQQAIQQPAQASPFDAAMAQNVQGRGAGPGGQQVPGA